MSIELHWKPDILGADWVAHTIQLGDDDEGPVTATLVRTVEQPRSRTAVLYIHGFVDYFFQQHKGTYFADRGIDFYAIDLRKYGRSLQPYQTPNYVESLAEYRAELDSAARIIAQEGHTDLIVLGHSTGGLIASLWVNARNGAAQKKPAQETLGINISGLILNSPWFDLNKPWIIRTAGTQAIRQLAKIAPKAVVGSLGPHYGRALHYSHGGEWTYNLHLKPIAGFPVRARWFDAVRRAHERVQAGLGIACPVLLLTSARSGDAERAHPEILTTDSVLNVKHMWDVGPHLGEDVSIELIAGGAHDLSLSPEPARTLYFDAISSWLEAEHLVP